MANAMPEYGGTVLRPGASGPDIALVQRWLGGLNVDGRYGTSTETAVRRFQREQGLKIDGHVGRDTWDALYRAWADKNGEGEIWPGVTMRRGSRGATVKSAQQKLKTLVPELTTDGRYGASTREAVLAWQVVHDLKPDGMLGRATWNSLYGVTTRKASQTQNSIRMAAHGQGAPYGCCYFVKKQSRNHQSRKSGRTSATTPNTANSTPPILVFRM